MAEFRSEFLYELVGGNENFSEEEFRASLKEYLEEGDRTTMPAATAPMESVPTPSMRIGMFMPSTVPELRDRENLATFIARFHTWACITRCDSALDSEIIVKTSGTLLAELERLHDRTLVDNSIQACQALTKALEKEEEMLKMVLDIGSLSEAWRALAKIADESKEVAHTTVQNENLRLSKLE